LGFGPGSRTGWRIRLLLRARAECGPRSLRDAFVGVRVCFRLRHPREPCGWSYRPMPGMSCRPDNFCFALGQSGVPGIHFASTLPSLPSSLPLSSSLLLAPPRSPLSSSPSQSYHFTDHFLLADPHPASPHRLARRPTLTGVRAHRRARMGEPSAERVWRRRGLGVWKVGVSVLVFQTSY
jgi:hypothetical protein